MSMIRSTGIKYMVHGKNKEKTKGPFLFNICLIDLFMFLEEAKVCNDADDTITFACGSKFETVFMHLECDVLKLGPPYGNP